MKSILTAAMLAALTLAPIASADANVVYTFKAANGGSAWNETFIRLELYSEVGESFSLRGGPSPGPIEWGTPYTGDIDKFIRVQASTYGADEGATPSYLRGVLSISLNVDALGNVTSSNFYFQGAVGEFALSGTGSTASGGVAIPLSGCQVQARNCAVNGTWELTSVPEPMSLALFGVGLAGLAAVRRRKA